MQYNTHQGILKQLKRKQSSIAWNKPFSLHKSCHTQTRTGICYIHPSGSSLGKNSCLRHTHLNPNVNISATQNKNTRKENTESHCDMFVVSRQRRNIVNISVFSTLVLKLQMRVDETDAWNLKYSNLPAMSPGNTALGDQGAGYQNWIPLCFCKCI